MSGARSAVLAEMTPDVESDQRNEPRKVETQNLINDMQRNVGTENWQEAREEGGCASICLEERIGFLGIVLGDEDIATILEHKRSPSLVANTIRGHRADHPSKGAGKSYQNYTQQGVDPA